MTALPRPLAALCLASLLAAGCTTTHLQSVWQDPDAPPGGFSRIGVIGLAERPTMRTYHEGHFVTALGKAGVHAEPSAEALPDLDAVDREAVQAWANEHGLTAVVTTRLVDIQRETWTVPTGGDLYYDVDQHMRHRSDVEGKEVIYHLETKLYQVDTGRLLFTARTESVRPVSPHAVVLSVIGTLVDELTRRGLVSPTGA